MAANQTCGTCGTVNVVTAGRCIACAAPFDAAPVDAAAPAPARPPAGDDDDTTGTVEIAPPPAPPAPSAHAPIAPPVPASAARADPPSGIGHATEDDSVTGEPDLPVPAAQTAERAAPARAAAEATVQAGESPPRDAPDDPDRFVVRVLLPEGDKRLVEVGSRKVALGSGLDELGLPGDPRVRSREAWMYVKDGRLWIEPAEGAQGVYRRLSGEETLAPGDVVLMGDVAACYDRLPPAPAVNADVMAVGGAANSPCGRLVFLRRDGSAGPVHDLPAGKTVLGRTDGHVNFPTDSRLSRRHARFVATEGRVTVEDLDSRNGTYLRIRRRISLDVGDALRVGSSGLQIRGKA